MDYTTQKISFKLKKAIRYIFLYGLARTLVKIRGQYHMKKKYSHFPKMISSGDNCSHVGLIGCGNYAFSNIAYYICKKYGHVIRAAMDIDLNKAASMYESYKLCYYTSDINDIVRDDKIDIVYIASNHASHSEYAISALDAGKSVHVEKPHAVNEDQLIRLCATLLRGGGKINLGFNRPYSKIGEAIKIYLDSQDGPMMLNWFIAGHEISPEHWYFKDEEGGRILGNLCHWTDFTLQLVSPENRYPLVITPTRGERSDCDIAVTYTFGDGSIAAITFSAKGHTFEGVRERFAAHRGNVLISMDDFKKLTVEVIDRKYKVFSFFRDHGHERNIIRSYEMVRPKNEYSSYICSVEYVWETGYLFLKTKEALENNEVTVITEEQANLGKNF